VGGGGGLCGGGGGGGGWGGGLGWREDKGFQQRKERGDLTINDGKGAVYQEQLNAVLDSEVEKVKD